MTSTSVPATTTKLNYSRDELLQFKDKPVSPLDERAVLNKLRYFRLDKNSVLLLTNVKSPNANVNIPKQTVLGNLENTAVKRKPLGLVQTNTLTQSAGPKLGRNTTDQIGKRNFAFDSKSKENNDPQLSTPSNFIKKPQMILTQETPLKIRASESSNTPKHQLLVTPKIDTPKLDTPKMATPNIVITTSVQGPEPLPSTPSFNPILMTPTKSSTAGSSSPGLPSSPSSASKCETDPHRLKQRQKQIDYGYRTIGYIKYTLQIAKDQRLKEHPKTPRKVQTCSKRSWDGQVKKWRRELHKWDPEDPTEFDKLMSEEILKFVYGESDEMPIIVTQLKEQIAEFMRTGTLGKISDNSMYDCIDDDDDDDEPTPNEKSQPKENDKKSVMMRSSPPEILQDNYRAVDIQKPSTVRMLVF